MEFERKIRKAGNSIGINIPVEILRETGLKVGDKIYIGVENDTIVIRSEKMKADNETFKQDVLKIIEEYMQNKEKV